MVECKVSFAQLVDIRNELLKIISEDIDSLRSDHMKEEQLTALVIRPCANPKLPEKHRDSGDICKSLEIVY